MAKKDETPKPFYSLHADYQKSVENLAAKANLLLTVVEIAIQNGKVQENVRDLLARHAQSLREALHNND